MTNLQQQLVKQFPKINFQLDYPLAEKTYFKVGGPAEVYVELADRQQIIDLVQYVFQEKIKLTILGEASNVIVDDKGIRGIVLHLLDDQVQVLAKENEKIKLRASTGVKMALLVQRTIAEGLTGLEYFLGVPGTLGGAVINNAHYLDHLIDPHIQRVEVINRQGQIQWLNHSDCDFAYDHSRFKISGEVLLQVELLLAKGDKKISYELIKKATLYRAQTQPLGMPSSGCIFQNVPNNDHLRKLFRQFKDQNFVPAGFLIDQAGLKGLTEGNIQVSKKHAAFFVNLGQGTSEQIKILITKVKQQVKAEFGVNLQEEVFYLN